MNDSHSCSFWSGLLACSHRLVLIRACLLAQTAFARFAVSATLEQLFGGSVITVGKSQFSNWQMISLDATSAAIPNLSQIVVTPLVNDPANPGLQFAANGQLSITGFNAIDLVFTFRVDALPGGKTFTIHALSLTGITFGTNSGLANISDDVTDRFGADLGSTVVISDKTSNFTQSLSSTSFASHSEVAVVSNVFIHGLSAVDAINLTSFTQTFSQTGPALLRGDFSGNGVVDTADIPPMLNALTDLNAFQMARGLSVFDLLTIGDLDSDGKVTNGDVQSLLNSLKGGGGSLAAIPEPMSAVLLALGLSCLGFAAIRRRVSGYMLACRGADEHFAIAAWLRQIFIGA